MFPIFIPIPIFGGGDGPRIKLWQACLILMVFFTVLVVVIAILPYMGWGTNVFDPDFCEPVKDFGRYDDCKFMHGATQLLVPVLALGYVLVFLLRHLDKSEEEYKKQRKKDKQSEEWE